MYVCKGSVCSLLFPYSLFLLPPPSSPSFSVLSLFSLFSLLSYFSLLSLLLPPLPPPPSSPSSSLLSLLLPRLAYVCNLTSQTHFSKRGRVW